MPVPTNALAIPNTDLPTVEFCSHTDKVPG